MKVKCEKHGEVWNPEGPKCWICEGESSSSACSEAVVFSTIVEKCPTCHGDAIHRFDYWEAAPENGRELESKLRAIRKAIRNYHLALDRRQNGDVAGWKCLKAIEQALGMSWRQGEMTKFLEDNPRLKPFYD